MKEENGSGVEKDEALTRAKTGKMLRGWTLNNPDVDTFPVNPDKVTGGDGMWWCWECVRVRSCVRACVGDLRHWHQKAFMLTVNFHGCMVMALAA